MNKCNVFGIVVAVLAIVCTEAFPSYDGNVIVIKGIPFNIDRHANRETITVATTTTTTTTTKAPSKNTNSTGALLMSNNSTVYDFQSQNFTNSANATDAEDQVVVEESIMSTATKWYLGCFGTLVVFFFVVTISEMFFGSPMYPRSPMDQSGWRRHLLGARPLTANQVLVEAPPPPYDLFAPPSYDTVKTDLEHGVFNEKTGNKLADVYVVPVHAPNACKLQVAEARGPTIAVAEVETKMLAVLSPTPQPKKKSQPPTPKVEPVDCKSMVEPVDCKSVDN